MIKFGFRIRTRGGTPVDHLAVQAQDQAQAERRIHQMYPHCEIIECRQMAAVPKDETVSLESIISLIARQDDEAR